MEDNSFITFVLNLKTNTIISTNVVEYLNESFDTFFKNVLDSSRLSNFNEPYSEDILLEELRINHSKVLSFHSKTSATIYQFSIVKVDNDIVSCNITFYNEIVNEKYFSKLDYLTGLLSRAYLIFEIEEKLKNNKDVDCCLFIIDLNDFKKINDTLGHRIGDEALRKFAMNLQSLSFDDNIIGRYGGDEFILFTMGKSEDELKKIAERILKTTSIIEHNGKKYITSCCLGGSIVKSSYATFDYLLERADNNLYQAKKYDKHCAFIDDIVVYGNSLKKVKRSNLKKFKLLNEEIKTKKRKNSLYALTFLIILTIFTVFTSFSLKNSLSKKTITEATTTMSMISEQIESTIASNINAWFSQLKVCDKMLESYNSVSLNQQAIDEVLAASSSQISFDQMALLLKSGDLYMQGGLHYSISTEKIAEEIIINNNSYIESIYINFNGQCVIFGIPFSNNETSRIASNNSICGICGLIGVDKIKSFLNTDAFEKSARVSIINDDGFSVAASNNSNEIYASQNFFNIVKENLSESDANTIYDNLHNNLNGKISLNLLFDDNTSEGMIFYSSLEFNSIICDWNIIIAVPKDNIIKNINQITHYILIIFILLLSLGAILVLICIEIINKNKLQLETTKYIDSVVDGINYKRFEIDGANLIKMSDKYALIYYNIIKFKYISEQLGKDKTDILLRNIYQLIQDDLSDNELVARLFEDRFVLLIQGEPEVISQRVNDIKSQIHDYIISQYNYNVFIVAGVYAPNKKIVDFNLANSKVRIALQNIGSDYLIHPICYYNDDMFFEEVNQNALESKAEMALANHDFVVYYQAKRNVQQNKWTSCEALVRWIDSQNNIIPPNKFIPLFEKNGFIVKLDLYVFEEVCKNLKSVIDSNKKPLKVSINVSRKNLLINNFIKYYEEIIKKYEIDPSLIEFELTESMANDNEEMLRETIKEIHRIGCTCSVDDFGSGYSSLGMLTKFDFDIIKLDRSFFMSSANSKQKSMTIIESVITLVKNLGKDVVAEGIEDEEQVEFLTKAKCDEIQGFYFSRPQPLNDFLSLIEKQ